MQTIRSHTGFVGKTIFTSRNRQGSNYAWKIRRKHFFSVNFYNFRYSVNSNIDKRSLAGLQAGLCPHLTPSPIPIFLTISPFTLNFPNNFRPFVPWPFSCPVSYYSLFVCFLNYLVIILFHSPSTSFIFILPHYIDRVRYSTTPFCTLISNLIKPNHITSPHTDILVPATLIFISSNTQTIYTSLLIAP